ncbi:hypothetical protein QQX98_006704 [Neonectria punicea]|uniref:NADP-dependent oxidoreductase domain-containing protein n=1 Tax=Neonectria punicea TaxID=979145 RepID=A0ABR1H060_9HYPO
MHLALAVLTTIVTVAHSWTLTGYETDLECDVDTGRYRIWENTQTPSVDCQVFGGTNNFLTCAQYENGGFVGPIDCGSAVWSPRSVRYVGATTTFRLNNGASIPVVGFGTWQTAPAQVETAVETALRSGYKHIDCAAIYRNEAEVGAGIKKSGVVQLSSTHFSKTWKDMEQLVKTGKARAIGVSNCNE